MNKNRIVCVGMCIIMMVLTLWMCGCSEAEGLMSITNNSSNELVCTIKTGANTYKKNYIYLNDYTMYVVEDITGTMTDPYHYQLYFHTDVLPDVDVKP